MLPHQQRVIDERDQLAERCQKLDAFINAGLGGKPCIFATLGASEQQDMQRQLHHMEAYKAALDRRIDRFTTEAKTES